MDFNLEMLKKIGAGIMDVAPSLAGAVISPNPVTVVNALTAIKNALGLGSDAPEMAVSKAIDGLPPEQRVILVKAEQDFKLAMRQEESKELIARLADVQNARQTQTDQVKITGKRDWSGEIFDWLITIGFFGVLGIRMFIEIPASQTENVGLLLGVLGTAFITVVNFKRGSSQSSRDKDNVIANSTPLKPCV